MKLPQSRKLAEGYLQTSPEMHTASRTQLFKQNKNEGSAHIPVLTICGETDIQQKNAEWKVQTGDSLWKIARAVTSGTQADTDSPSVKEMVRLILEANQGRYPQLLRHPHLIDKSMTLIIPKADSVEKSAQPHKLEPLELHKRSTAQNNDAVVKNKSAAKHESIAQHPTIGKRETASKHYSTAKHDAGSTHNTASTQDTSLKHASTAKHDTTPNQGANDKHEIDSKHSQYSNSEIAQTKAAQHQLDLHDASASERTVASWYGKFFNGRTTSSGEKYDVTKLTAAHKTLPFGTLVEVTNPSNGHSVVVKINDRGPFVQGRDLDLTPTAARKLGTYDSGIANVCYRVIASR